MKKKIILLACIACTIGGSQLFAQSNVGIGTNMPTEKLDVNGNVKADTLKANVLQIAPNAGAGKVFVSDANGNGSWQTGPVGPAGPTGPVGPAGPTGASGIFVSGGSSGYAGASIAAAATAYVFVGPTATVTVNGTQRIIFFGEAPLACATGSTTAYLGACYSLNGTGPITNFVGGGYSIIEIGTERHPLAVAGSVILGAGTYTIGIGIRNNGATALTDNDYVNYTYMVVNQ